MKKVTRAVDARFWRRESDGKLFYVDGDEQAIELPDGFPFAMQELKAENRKLRNVLDKARIAANSQCLACGGDEDCVRHIACLELNEAIKELESDK